MGAPAGRPRRAPADIVGGMGLGSYGSVLRERQVRLVLAAWSVTGLSTGLTLAIVLTIRESHSFAAAGAVVAAEGVCAGIFSPLRGRQVDARGQTAVIVPLALASAGSLA